jgi:hypothetical protein
MATPARLSLRAVGCKRSGALIRGGSCRENGTSRQTVPDSTRRCRHQNQPVCRMAVRSACGSLAPDRRCPPVAPVFVPSS